MMGRALLIVGPWPRSAFIASGGAGLRACSSPADAGMPRHVLVALASSLLLLFSHCWIMFYLIGTGRAIREAVRENGLEAPADRGDRAVQGRLLPLAAAGHGAGHGHLRPRRRRGHRRDAPGSTTSCSTPRWSSRRYALWIERRVLAANERLMVDVDGRLSGPRRGRSLTASWTRRLALHPGGPVPASAAGRSPSTRRPRPGWRACAAIPRPPVPGRASLNPLRHFDLRGLAAVPRASCWG